MIRTATHKDLDTLVEITQRAYGSSSHSKETLERNFNIQPDGFFLAYVDNQPVGMVAIFDYGSFASIGTLGVVPEAQGRGVGRKLMEQAELWAKQKNIPSLVLDATSDGAKLYEKMGFVDIDVNYKMLLKTLPAIQTSNVRPFILQDQVNIIKLDKAIFGANRQRVLKAFLKHYSDRTFVSYDPQDNLYGFIIAQPSTLGPWIALSEGVAKNLLQAALGLPFTNSPRVLLPGQNKAGLELLQKVGFEISITLRHMVKGIPNQQRQNIFGQASYSLG